MTDNPKERTAVGKCPLWLLPMPALEIVARVFEHGLTHPDREPYNWRIHPIKASTYISASRRHDKSWVEREDLDPESKYSHLAHKIATDLITLDALLHGTLIDDRPPQALRAYCDEKARASRG